MLSSTGPSLLLPTYFSSFSLAIKVFIVAIGFAVAVASADKVNAVPVPKCLEQARDILATMMLQTYEALDQRRPSRPQGGYAEGRMRAKLSYDEYQTEVNAQIPNAR